MEFRRRAIRRFTNNQKGRKIQKGPGEANGGGRGMVPSNYLGIDQKKGENIYDYDGGIRNRGEKC